MGGMGGAPGAGAAGGAGGAGPTIEEVLISTLICLLCSEMLVEPFTIGGLICPIMSFPDYSAAEL